VQNNPLKYTDPTGHVAALAAIGWALGTVGISAAMPIIAAIAAALTVAALLVFLSDAGNRAWLIAQIEGGVDNLKGFASKIALMSRKSDLSYVDYLVNKYKLSKTQRRRLHDAISGKNLSNEEIEEIAEELADESKKDK
jgi:hypothetical protein